MFDLGSAFIRCTILDPRILRESDARRIAKVRERVMAVSSGRPFDDGRQSECSCGTDGKLACSG